MTSNQSQQFERASDERPAEELPPPDRRNGEQDQGRWRRLFDVVVDFGLGLGFIAVGVAGLVLPVLPGWLFIIPGIVLLAGRIPPIRRALDRVLTSRPVDAGLERGANNDSFRHTVASVLKKRRVRRAVSPPTRQHIVHRLAESAAGQGDSGNDDADDSEERSQT